MLTSRASPIVARCSLGSNSPQRSVGPRQKFRPKYRERDSVPEMAFAQTACSGPLGLTAGFAVSENQHTKSDMSANLGEASAAASSQRRKHTESLRGVASRFHEALTRERRDCEAL
jgi:hypothetical protein